MTGRTALLLATAGLALAAPAAAGAATVVVVPADGGARVPVDLAPLAATPDVAGATYVVRRAAGAATRRTVTGTSLGALLAASRADVSSFAYADVEAPDGTAVRLSRAQALATPADGAPVLVDGPAGAGFLRASAGPDDPNGDDELRDAATLTVRLRASARLAVRVEASRTRVDVGEPVTLSAEVEGAGAGEAAEIAWTVLGPVAVRGGSGTSLERTFRRPGTYRVLAGATTASEPTGASAVVEIEVGRAEEEAPRPARTTTSTAAAPPVAPAPSAAPTPTPATSAPAGRPGGTAAPARRTTTTTKAPTPRPRRAPTGDLVEGELVLDAVPVAATTATPAGGSPAGVAVPAAADGGLAVPPDVLRLLGALAVVALGAALHHRRTAPGRA